MALPLVMGSARAQAIVLLAQLLDRRSDQRLAEDVTACVDALIEAARAPESAHTRAVQEIERETNPRRGDALPRRWLDRDHPEAGA